MAQDNLDSGALQETKLTDRVYTRGSSGYSTVSKDALIQHHVRVAVFYCATLRFPVKSLQQFGPNVVILWLVEGGQLWYIFGC